MQIDYNANIVPGGHFTWGEFLWLKSWQVHHIPSPIEIANLTTLAIKMESVRALFSKSINVHVAIRPILNNPASVHHGENYNALVGGALNSAHKDGRAIDFDVVGISCDDARSQLEPFLEPYGMRMEKKPGSNWLHLDFAQVPPGGHRYFLP